MGEQQDITYPLSWRQPAAGLHHLALSQLLDPLSFDVLQRHGASLGGARCLEVGAGQGSVALWLARRGALVTAIDLDISRVPTHPNITPLTWDLREHTDAVPGAPFAVIHSRLTLQHVPGREAVLAWLAGMLAPGGVLIEEGWRTDRTDVVIEAPHPSVRTVYNAYQQVVSEEIFAASGTDRVWVVRVPELMRGLGLRAVAHAVTNQRWAGGEPGLVLTQAMLSNLWGRLLQLGFTKVELELLHQACDSKRLVVAGHPFWQIWGHRETPERA